MVALLVAMSIMAVMLTVAMPVWKQNVQREKEEELVFRGKQYVHAIELYGRKFANTQPPSVDVLVEQKFLRKKYKDPVTNQDFDLLRANQAVPQPGAGPQSAAPGRGGAPGTSGVGSGGFGPAPQPGQSSGASQIGSPGANPIGGIIGVASKSKEKSIRLYNGRGHYNEWAFVYQPQQGPGAGGAPGIPGQRGGPGNPGGAGPLGRGRGDGRGRGPNGPQRGPGSFSNPNNPFGSGTSPFGNPPTTPNSPPSRGRN
jgi:type II secretory pathway pseudopilin PulG